MLEPDDRIEHRAAHFDRVDIDGLVLRLVLREICRELLAGEVAVRNPVEAFLVFDHDQRIQQRASDDFRALIEWAVSFLTVLIPLLVELITRQPAPARPTPPVRVLLPHPGIDGAAIVHLDLNGEVVLLLVVVPDRVILRIGEAVAELPRNGHGVLEVLR